MAPASCPLVQDGLAEGKSKRPRHRHNTELVHRRDPELVLFHHGQGETPSEHRRKFNLVESVCQVELQTVERLQF